MPQKVYNDLATMEFDEWPNHLKPGEVAELFRVDPKTVTRWAAAGRIDSVRTLGGHRLFDKQDVWDAWKRGETW